MRKLNGTKLVTIGAMCTALGVLCLYAAAVMPTGRVALYFIASLFVYVPAAEGAYLGSVTVYIATSLTAFLILPTQTAAVPYAVLLGHFGIFKTWFDSVMPDKVVQSAVKVLYCDLFMALGVFWGIKLFNLDLTDTALTVPAWAVVLLIQVAFFVYDKLYWMCQRIYDERIRSYISPRR